MLTALLVATATGLATGLGAAPYFVWAELPRRLYDGVMGAGAGLMLSAATLGLMHEALVDVRAGDALDGGVLAQVLVGFVAGVGLLALMDRLIPHHHARGHREHIHPGAETHLGGGHAREHHHDPRQGLLVAGAMTIHRLPEGFAIGAGFAAGAEHTLGWMLAAAVAFQNVCEGAVMAAPLRAAGWSRVRVLAIVTATGLAVPLAALGGHAAAAATVALPFFLALAAGGLIWLISNEIIPETHSHGNEGVATFGLVGGFLLTIVVRSVAGH